MPTIDLSDDEHAAVTAAVRSTIYQDRFPRSPRMAPLKSALAKLNPASVPKPRPTPAPLRGGARAQQRRPGEPKILDKTLSIGTQVDRSRWRAVANRSGEAR
jgi:hypothetical protein